MAKRGEISSWIGRVEERCDVIRAEPVRFLQATLDLRAPAPAQGDALAPLWHWLYFLSAEPRSKLGRDGHARKGDFLPPIALPRRMWAGGRFEFHRPLTIGAEARKRSVIADISTKTGRSGELCFVTVHHEISDGSGLCMTEVQDLVYCEDPKPGSVPPARLAAPAGAMTTQTLEPDTVLLFRFSALTFNSHRIHYDRDYACNVENYPDLVFHGPLTALLLSQLAARYAGNMAMKNFSFRALAPLFADRPFTLNANRTENGFDLWAAAPDGTLAMTAISKFG